MSLRRIIRSALVCIGLLAVSGSFSVIRLPPPLQHCTPDEVVSLTNALPPYLPSLTPERVTLRDGRFEIGGMPFTVRGVNYYPARYPWRRFLTAPLPVIESELDLLRDAGFNTLRVFMWYEALFQCEANGAVPELAGFQAVDALFHAASARGFRLIVTLHDLPDLTNYPLYDDPAHVRDQTAFFVSRYRDERAILAFDVRNEGDIDYGTNKVFGGGFMRVEVLSWLGEMTAHVRQHAPQTLITAGWFTDALATSPYVDFISFHHWSDAADLQHRIRDMRARTRLPLLLEEVGYSTFAMSAAEQREALELARATAETEGLLGWLIWAAFDFPRDATCYPSPCLSEDNAEHHFGIWTADYRRK
jgi:endo-1,4-beta-mannosidase